MKTTRLFEDSARLIDRTTQNVFAIEPVNEFQSTNSPLSEALENQVRSELEADEKVVWSGQPIPSRFAKQTMPIFLFGVPWTAFAVFWMCGAAAPLWAGGNQKHDVFSMLFPLFGLPFVLIGIGMLSAPWWAYRAAFRTCYVITTKRAILFTGLLNKSVEIRSYRPEQLTRVSRKENLVTGIGDLILEEFEVKESEGSKSKKSEGFIGIPHVREVEKLLRRTLLETMDE